MDKTVITLEPDDFAFVGRESGELEMYVPQYEDGEFIEGSAFIVFALSMIATDEELQEQVLPIVQKFIDKNQNAPAILLVPDEEIES